MRYYYGIIFKGEIMKIKKWLGVAAIATVAGLTLVACGIQKESRQQNSCQNYWLKLTVVVEEHTLG